jgi:hypothetical protein
VDSATDRDSPSSSPKRTANASNANGKDVNAPSDTPIDLPEGRTPSEEILAQVRHTGCSLVFVFVFVLIFRVLYFVCIPVSGSCDSLSLDHTLVPVLSSMHTFDAQTNKQHSSCGCTYCDCGVFADCFRVKEKVFVSLLYVNEHNMRVCCT